MARYGLVIKIKKYMKNLYRYQTLDDIMWDRYGGTDKKGCSFSDRQIVVRSLIS